MKRALREIHSDILILGSGGAGLFAALHAHQAAPELSITVAVKGLLGKCGCTRMVQGGYNVALAPGDSIERHFMDTIEGGKWLPDQELAWKLVTLAVERIRELENELGCFFDRNPDGTIHQRVEGREWLVTVGDFCPDKVEQIRAHVGVEHVEVEDPGLEDLFKDFIKGQRAAS